MRNNFCKSFSSQKPPNMGPTSSSPAFWSHCYDLVWWLYYKAIICWNENGKSNLHAYVKKDCVRMQLSVKSQRQNNWKVKSGRRSCETIIKFLWGGLTAWRESIHSWGHIFNSQKQAPFMGRWKHLCSNSSPALATLVNATWGCVTSSRLMGLWDRLIRAPCGLLRRPSAPRR